MAAMETDRPIFQPQRTLSVAVIGAGASGLLLAYKLQRHFSALDLTVYERNPAVSGTWFENTYPGCACDVPAHCYTYSFEPKTDWSANYAGSDEIRQYFTCFCARHGLDKYIRLEHQVVAAKWEDKAAQWLVTVKDLRTGSETQTRAHVLISATGILNKWKWPAIDGLHSFKGKLLHSAAWDSSVDLEGKTVGLIGNGSSGIQVLPAITPMAKRVVHFIRQPTWIAPPVGEEYHRYTDGEKERFATDPKHHLELRRATEQRMNGKFETFLSGSAAQNLARQYVQASMQTKLADHELADRLVPDFPFGCRRPTPGTGYLEALREPNVHTVIGDIARVDEQGVVTADNVTQAVDVLICATGFDTSYRPSFPIVGSTGQSLSDAWATEVRGYLGLAVPGYPNFFTVLGPGCPVGNGPVLIAMEHQVGYVVRMLAKFQKEDARAFAVREEAAASFNAWADDFMRPTVWARDCRSWYKAGSASGRVVALWPGSTLHYIEAVREPRFEDWSWLPQPDANPWAFLGNGYSSAEKRPGGDPAWYIRSHDDSPLDPCLVHHTAPFDHNLPSPVLNNDRPTKQNG
ncbi:hypothetical protein AJ79_09812 [Neofusicoccum parvum]|nr:hypothetical protein AJ79_09812 [Neofusicoccum parvum]